MDSRHGRAQGFGSRALRAAGLLVVLPFVLACAGDDGAAPPPDAAGRDASVVDGALLDAATDAGVDAGADAGRDARPPQPCPGPCDPAFGVCADGSACVLNDVEPMCLPGGALEEDAPCFDNEDCAPGLACFLARAGGVCRRVCCPRKEGDCLEGERCGGTGLLYDGTETAFRSCFGPAPATRSIPTPVSPVRGATSSLPRATRTAARRASRRSETPASTRTTAPPGSPASA